MGCGASKVAAAQPDPPLRTVSPPTHDADGKPRRPSDTEVNSFRAAAGVSSQGLAVSSATIARMSGEWEQQESFKAKTKRPTPQLAPSRLIFSSDCHACLVVCAHAFVDSLYKATVMEKSD